jgi:hypothetical protein
MSLGTAASRQVGDQGANAFHECDGHAEGARQYGDYE